jgi:8-oxo-dGTP pyrophosphatase MutT (NUDIX family)
LAQDAVSKKGWRKTLFENPPHSQLKRGTHPRIHTSAHLTKPVATTADMETVCFALTILTRPSTRNSFVLVRESRNRGWWLPAGAMDDGETVQKAAAREALEEAGCQVRNLELLRVEQAHCRIRWIVTGSVDPASSLKSVADKESMCASWVSLEHTLLIHAHLAPVPDCKLRGTEPLVWFSYLNRGGKSYSLSRFVDTKASKGASAFDGRWI